MHVFDRRRLLRCATARCLAGATGAFAMTACTSPPPAAGPSPARRVVFEHFESRLVKPRRVDVWLPPGYDDGAPPCGVLYMHDGRNLFDPATAMAGQPWAVDTHLAALIAAHRVRPTIIVGIDNTDWRWREYAPQAAVEALAPEWRAEAESTGGGPPVSEAYLRFIVEELKPFVDGRFRTRPARADTALMGSSMGGLISLYGLCRYPAVFGGAGCVSTHWPLMVSATLLQRMTPGELAPTGLAFIEWLRTHLPAAGSHRLYFDHGSEHLDALYAPYQRLVDRLVADKGYRSGVDVLSLDFPGATHNEPSWRARVDRPLEFLLRA